MSTYVFNNIRIHYEYTKSESVMERGESPALVMLHGYASCSKVWRNQIDFFSRRYSVLAPDIRGWGQSQKPTEIESYKLDNLVGDLGSLLERLGLNNIVLMGSSMGGLIAQQFYLKNKNRVKGLVLVGTRAHARGDLKDLISQINDMGPKSIIIDTIESCFDKFERPDLVRLLVNWSRIDQSSELEQKASAIGCLKAFEGFNLQSELKSYDCPVLIVFGEKDKITSTEEAKFLHQNIPQSHLEIINGSGHLPMFETPDRFNKIMEKFLTQVIKENS